MRAASPGCSNNYAWGEARAELEAAGIELIGGLETDSSWTWVHFRAPDGNLYAVASRQP